MIRVLELEDIETPLLIAISSIPLNVSDYAVQCTEEISDFHTYTYTVLSTPILRSLSQQKVVSGDRFTLELEGISDVEDDNIFLFGGNTNITCSSPSPPILSTVNTHPVRNISIIMRTYSNYTVVCVVPNLPVGTYRPVLHVAGRGWGHSSLEDTMITIHPQIMSAPSIASGSLRGGLLLTLSTRGLFQSDLLRTRVKIGNTPCRVQNINDQGLLTCFTQAAVDDGYSSLVEASSPLAYWTVQTDYHRSNGSYLTSDGFQFFRNRGVLGSRANASVHGTVSLMQEGISGNNFTDQSILFTEAAYLQVPPLEELTRLSGFALEFWMRVPNNIQHYQIVINASSLCENVACGFLVVLNPCSQIEFWLASGDGLEQLGPGESNLEEIRASGSGSGYATLSGSGSDLGSGGSTMEQLVASGNNLEPFPDNNEAECSLITDILQCPGMCSGHIRVSEQQDLLLPAGVWHVIRNTNHFNLSDWNHIYVSWQASDNGQSSRDCTTATLCNGTQQLVVNGESHSLPSTYLGAANAGIEIGGSSLFVPGSTGVWNGLTPFTGYLDEVAYYSQPLELSEISSRVAHGIQDTQPIGLSVEGFNGVGTGSAPNVRYPLVDPPLNLVAVDWESVMEMERTFQESVTLQFEWAM